jgi:hypothetical protein
MIKFNFDVDYTRLVEMIGYMTGRPKEGDSGHLVDHQIHIDVCGPAGGNPNVDWIVPDRDDLSCRETLMCALNPNGVMDIGELWYETRLRYMHATWDGHPSFTGNMAAFEAFYGQTNLFDPNALPMSFICVQTGQELTNFRDVHDAIEPGETWVCDNMRVVLV